MAVPKRKTSKQRRNKRRASSYTLKMPTINFNKETGEATMPHRVDLNTGLYNGKKVLDLNKENNEEAE